jgi:hypothetical protein
VPAFADRGYRVVSATDPHAVNLGFLDRSPYFSIQVVPQLSSWRWVDPVPDPLLLRKYGSARNPTRDLWICSQELWPVDHRGGPYNSVNINIVKIEFHNFSINYTYWLYMFSTAGILDNNCVSQFTPIEWNELYALNCSGQEEACLALFTLLLFSSLLVTSEMCTWMTSNLLTFMFPCLFSVDTIASRNVFLVLSRPQCSVKLSRKV